MLVCKYAVSVQSVRPRFPLPDRHPPRILPSVLPKYQTADGKFCSDRLGRIKMGSPSIDLRPMKRNVELIVLATCGVVGV